MPKRGTNRYSRPHQGSSDEKRSLYKFSVPVYREADSSPALAPLAARGEAAQRSHGNGNSTAGITLHQQCTFGEGEGMLHYMGTRAVLGGDGALAASSPARRGTKQARESRSYTIVIQATPLAEKSTTAKVECIGRTIKLQIDLATEKARYRCLPMDNLGYWKMSLHISINEGDHNAGGGRKMLLVLDVDY
ncbi:uncharacterized protein PG986_008812 [Apiospora aurea]|uniref:Uncharacterized protein n=1 Tax=Apiospora aurea TaxID=335848 RepID=A0ABR1Q5U1_9PEZI